MALTVKPNPSSDALILAQELRAFSGKLKRRLRAQADTGDLTPSQTGVLLRLEDSPATTTSLARAEGIRPQSMGAIIDVLEAKGFVEGSPDPKDGRQKLLAMTDHCREWIAHGRSVRQDWLSRVIDNRLSMQERSQLAAVIPLLHRIIEE